MRTAQLLTITAGALLAAWGCTPGPAAQPPAAFEYECGRCHSLEVSLKKEKDRAGWERSVSTMRKLGAELTDQEAEAIIDYLSKVASP